MKKMLSYNPQKRPSANELLNEPWIKNNACTTIIDKEQEEKILTNLKNFNASQKLSNAALFYIVHRLTSQKEIKKLKDIFLQLDKNSDGKLSYQEVIEGFSKVFGDAGAENTVKLIFEHCMKEINEFISYEEFITASIDKTNLLTEEKLEAAFRLFDKDGNGFISPSEIKEVLGKDSFLPESYWVSIVREADENGDEQISFEEFRNVMTKILECNDLNDKFTSSTSNINIEKCYTNSA